MATEPPAERRVPPDLTRTLLSKEEGTAYAWTTVLGVATPRTQVEEGMGKGQLHYRVAYQCPRCDEAQHFFSPGEHGQYPVQCHCDAAHDPTLMNRYVFLVKW